MAHFSTEANDMIGQEHTEEGTEKSLNHLYGQMLSIYDFLRGLWVISEC